MKDPNHTTERFHTTGDPEVDHIDSLNEEAWKLRYNDQTASREKATAALRFSGDAGYAKGEAYAKLNLAVGHFLKSENKDALELLGEANGFFRDHQEEPGYAAVLTYMGNIYESFGDYETALDHCQKAYNAASKFGHKELSGEVYSVFGLIYSRLSDFESALKAYEESLRIRKESGDELAEASSLNRIARIHTLKKEYDRALEYYSMSQGIRQRLGQKDVLPWTFLGMATTYEEMGNLQEALDFYQRILEDKNQKPDNRCKLQATLGLGRTYHELKQGKDALSCFSRALELAEQMEAKPLQVETHYALAGFYESAGEFENALHHYKKYRSIREAVLNDESRNRMKNQQIAFAVEKSEKEKEIFQLRNVELKSAYDEIHHKNKEITDSINYASRIQTALLPPNESLLKAFPEHFILYFPRDVVSGDFYWSARVGEKVVFTAADCTGHGVPGALMSMLGISYLNELVVERGQTDPGEILDNLRGLVMKALKQSGRDEDQKDGMDMALCTYDTGSRILQYAGAYNPLYLVREGILEEFKADRMPISYYNGITKPFQTRSIRMQEGDAVYLFSDGYADQFGGPHGKKFKYKSLKALLELIHEKPMENQKLVLYEKFFAWKGGHAQIDDVVMIGIRI